MLKVPKKDNVGTEEYFYVGNTAINPLFNILLAGITEHDKLKFAILEIKYEWETVKT